MPTFLRKGLLMDTVVVIETKEIARQLGGGCELEKKRIRPGMCY